MTIASASISNTERRTTALGVLCALALVATACGTSNSDDAADGPLVEVGTGSDSPVVTGSDSANGFDHIEFGDSLEDLSGANTAAADPVNITLPGFQRIEWEDLIPPGFSSEDVLARYEDRLAAAEPGSAELDALYEEMNTEYDVGSVNTQLDGEPVQLAGFVAPLTYEGDRITEFLLVPYFGACIHVPPPPVNQTVMVTLAEGESLSLEESWGAIWVAGTMLASATDTSLATAGYTISNAEFDVYETQ